MTSAIPTLILGGTGYVSGELLRLLAGHPRFEVAGVISLSRPGEPIAEVFPHLHGAYADLRFSDKRELSRWIEGARRLAVFAAGPHGESASEIDQLLGAAEPTVDEVHLVDLSADFRFRSAEQYARIYEVEHAAPHRLEDFVCAVPEHAVPPYPKHACHPGCFTTAVTLPAAALVRLDLIEPVLHVSAVTGSTGAGRVPKPTTHHPERQSNLFAYGALGHRHEPEMVGLVAAATGVVPEINFVPHSGPFARGIHATLHATLKQPMDASAVEAALAEHYRDAPFVTVQASPPRVKQVAGTNHCRIGVAARGQRLVVFSVIDNLVKGAAGGAIQWMNKLFGVDETEGLMQPGLGWI